ncbi:HEPN domain-containing protein [Pedobacter psychroterrae]|uniref:RiboL-PSP-HEPN domain-containing protein n=1 Tax=Pedobacter psychroterrae TaxID=2530453 RepID=A0A4R0NQ14_9SPHI|nr:HEPN domain-containing protein [Pedobacter psychroterrae]TCD03130.1 hypothetical protein EZ437_03910 [Pedobacter psychroterrae]
MEQSNAYIAFKKRTQEIFSFAVLVTSSVPILKYNITLYNKGSIKRISEPDYFQPSVIYEINDSTLSDLRENGLDEEKLALLLEMKDTPLNNREFKDCVVKKIGETAYKTHRNILKRQSGGYISNLYDCTSGYQTKLASYLFFSLFSYFEAFIGELTKEVIEHFQRLDVPEYLSEMQTLNLTKEYRNLNNVYDPRKIDKYKKYSRDLQTKGYQKPENLMFSSMLDLLKSTSENMKANEIPAFLKKFYFFEMDEIDNDTYHNFRDNRNSIGHGATSFIPTLKNVTDANKFFRRISKEIDSHVTRHYMNLTNFQNPR